VDVSIVVASAIKQQLVPKLARPPAIIAVWKVTYPVTAQWRQNRSRAINVVRKAILPGIALKMRTVARLGEEVLAGVAVAVAAPRPSAIVVEKPDISLVPAPRPLEATLEDMEAEEVAATAASEVVVVSKRLAILAGA